MTNAVANVRAGLSSHGALVLKLCVVLWTIVILAAVFFIMQG